MNPVDTTSGVISNLKTWAVTPLKNPVSPFGLFLVVGLLIVITVAWTMIIHELEVTL